MLFIDSNVLIRLATADDKVASEKAATFISEQPKNSIEILDAVLVEVCFVLEFHEYQMNRDDICDFLEIVLDFSQVRDHKEQREVLKLFRKYKKLDYTDCLLLQSSGSKDSTIYTFDNDLLSVC